MNDILFEILKLIVMVVAGFAAGTYFHVRGKWAKEFDAFSAWVKVAVDWAQQVYWAENGQMRKGVVMEFLKTLRNKHKVNLSDEQIEVLVEAAVKQMNKAELIGYYELTEGPEDGDA